MARMLARELLALGRTPLGGDPEITRVTGPCRQAITTRFHGPTDNLDPRITARCAAGSVTVVWDDTLDERDNHAMAAAALAVRLEWCTFATFASHYAMGSTRDGYTFVEIYSRADLHIVKGGK